MGNKLFIMSVMKAMSKFQISGGLRCVIDAKKSKALNAVTAEGHNLLDMYCQIASLPLGYNDPDMLKVAEDNLSLSIHRFAVNVCPPTEHAHHLNNVYDRVTPPSM